MPWKKLLAFVSGRADQKPFLQNEFLREEVRVCHAFIQRQCGRLKLTDPERVSLAEKGKALGKLLGDTVTIVQPETILKWHRELIAKKWDYSKKREAKTGRPPTAAEIESLIVQFAKDNPSWGYDRIVGALNNLGHIISDQTVGNILKKHGLGIAPERRKKTTWNQFIRRHKNVLWATDFFTTEVWTKAGLATFYTLFFIHLATRKVVLGGSTRNPSQSWICQIARNLTADAGELAAAKYLIHDRAGQYCPAFDAVFESAGIEPVILPPKSPNLNAYAERFVRSVKNDCLDQLILFGEKSLHHTLSQYVAH
jgi:transposase InsO family protein